jgi:hypothetical protein
MISLCGKYIRLWDQVRVGYWSRFCFRTKGQSHSTEITCPWMQWYTRLYASSDNCRSLSSFRVVYCLSNILHTHRNSRNSSSTIVRSAAFGLMNFQYLRRVPSLSALRCSIRGHVTWLFPTDVHRCPVIKCRRHTPARARPCRGQRPVARSVRWLFVNLLLSCETIHRGPLRRFKYPKPIPRCGCQYSFSILRWHWTWVWTSLLTELSH